MKFVEKMIRAVVCDIPKRIPVIGGILAEFAGWTDTTTQDQIKDIIRVQNLLKIKIKTHQKVTDALTDILSGPEAEADPLHQPIEELVAALAKPEALAAHTTEKLDAIARRFNDDFDAFEDHCVRIFAPQTVQDVGAGAVTVQVQGDDNVITINSELPEGGAVGGYHRDIENLKQYSDRTALRLSDFARIMVNEEPIKIPRNCVTTLIEAAKEDNLLVIGSPGSGKSGALYDMVHALTKAGRDVVFLAADSIEARTPTQLRQELELAHPLVDVLSNWPGAKPGFLVIDALDAARGEDSARELHNLLQDVARMDSRWRAVATIREFDLRYRPELHELFSGSPVDPSLSSPDFSKIRHLTIPQLTDHELDQAGSQSSQLLGLLTLSKTQNPQDLLELLRNPFNLRLAASILADGVQSDELTTCRSQIELLDRYWLARVVGNDGNGFAREDVIRNACKQMVQDKSLKIPVGGLNPAANSAHIDQLLTNNVLREWRRSPQSPPTRNAMTFSHHVLFDYAVAKTLFMGQNAAVLDRIQEDTTIVLRLRPSLVYYFQDLWLQDDSLKVFWERAFQFLGEGAVPRIGQLLGPSVSVELARSSSDFNPLYMALESGDTDLQLAAEKAVTHIAGSLMAMQIDIAGSSAGPWCQWLAEVSGRMQSHSLGAVRALLRTVTVDFDLQSGEQHTPEQFTAVGVASRHLLTYALDKPEFARSLVPVAVPAIRDTFASDPVVSETLLRKVIGCESQNEIGLSALNWLTRMGKRFAKLPAKLQAYVYEMVFTSPEPEDMRIPLGNSQIFGLSTTLKQEFSMVERHLAEAFEYFLQGHPLQAVNTLATVIEAYCTAKHDYAKPPPAYSFAFGSSTAHYVPDGSGIWDEGSVNEHDAPVMMLDSFQNYVESLASDPSNMQRIEGIVAGVAEQRTRAVIWRRLLKSGSAFPEVVGKHLLALIMAPIVLVGYETSADAGEMLRGVFPNLDAPQRRRIECSIVGLPSQDLPMDVESLDCVRDQLLGCLPKESIVTREATERVEELLASDTMPVNGPPFRHDSGHREIDDDYWMEQQGIDPKLPANIAFQDVVKPIDELVSRLRNNVPTDEELLGDFESMQKAYRTMDGAADRGVHDKLITSALGRITEACCALLQNGAFIEMGECLPLVEEILITASRHPEPVANQDSNTSFDKDVSWGGDCPRIKAAEALPLLARRRTGVGQDVLDAIRQLSNDPANVVRFMTAERIRFLCNTAPELMWDIIETIASRDTSPPVLFALVHETLWRFVRDHADRVIPLVQGILARLSQGQCRFDPRGACVSLLTNAFLNFGNEASQQTVLSIVDNALDNLEDALKIGGIVRGLLARGSNDTQTTTNDNVRKGAWDLMDRLCKSATTSWRILHEKMDGRSWEEWSESECEQRSKLAHLLDSLSMDFYFASGAFDEKMEKPETRPLTAPEKQRFLLDAQGTLDALASVGLVPVAHRLVEALQIYITTDPKPVFMRIGQIIISAENEGYQNEPLASQLIVEIIERYLATYPEIFREETQYQEMLMSILDIFVDWPEARRLVYRNPGTLY